MLVPPRWPVKFCAAALVSLVCLSGCATQRSPAAQQARMRTLRSELLARGDPDSLAAAAIFERWSTGEWHDAVGLAARAAAVAPERTEFAYLQLVLCYQMPSCRPEPLEVQLRARDPANGITWISALGRATDSNDGAGVRAALDGLAQSQRVDLYWTTLVSHLTAAVTGRAGFDQMNAFVAVIGMDAAMAIPPLHPIETACSRSALADGEIRSQCRRIAAVLEHADSILFESYGNRVAARVWPEGSAEGIAIAARRRVLDYRMSLWTSKSRQLNSPNAMRTLVTFVGQYPTEQQAYVALYASLGLNPEPPADWKKPEPHG
jgi:hypothetical protein